MSETC